MTPDPLQQIREALERITAHDFYEGTNKHASYCRRCAALALLDGLRLLPDGHVAVPVEVVERMVTLVEWYAKDAGSQGAAMDGALLRASLAGGRGNECEHEWVDARNEAVISGEMCPKCNAVRAAEHGNEPSRVQRMAAAFDRAATDDSANEPPDFTAADDFGRGNENEQT